MKPLYRAFVVMILVILLTGCFYFHRPWSYPIAVKIVNNSLCFTLVGDRMVRQHTPKHNGFMLQKVFNGQYELVWSTPGKPDNKFYPVKISECLPVEFDNWQAGEYILSTGVWFDGGIDNRYYRVKFTLTRDPLSNKLALMDVK